MGSARPAHPAREITARFAKLPIRNRNTWAGALLVLVSVLSFAGSVRGPFLWDELDVIVQDPSVASLGNIPSFFVKSSEPPREYDSRALFQLKYYRPVTKSVIALERAALGDWTTGYHLVSVFLNAAVCVVFFLLVKAITGHVPLALFASLLYAVNPSRGEAVNWIYSVSSILEGLFALLSLLFFVQGRKAASWVAFGAALLSRESALHVLPVLGAYELCLSRRTVREKARILLPFAAIGAGFLLLRYAIVGQLPPLSTLAPVTFLNTCAVVFQRLLKLSFVPDSAVALYRLETFPALTLEVALSWGVVIAFACLGAFLWKRDRAAAFWWAWIPAWLLLQFNVGGQGEGLLAEKHMYLAWGGFAVLIAAFLLRVRHGLPALLLLIALHGGVTVWRATYWNEPVEFFGAVLRFSPDYWQARYSLALTLGERGLFAEAAPHLERVLEQQPLNSPALNGLANCRYALGDPGAAEELWEKALAADPRNSSASFNLGFLAERRGDLPTALEYYQRTLALGDGVAPRAAEKLRALTQGL
ncbi:MAG: tetratricopeptide repeat protein [Oligoflexia bacterium]|nr:tetratricopeptide repeat protein [Oligoflexia bacterium]